MRRRTLLGESNIEYVFSAETTSVSVDYYSSSTDVRIKSTANDSNIGYSVVSYDGTVVTSVTTAATSVTIYYSTNTTPDQRSGYVVLKQDGSNKTITINLSQSDGNVFSAERESVSISYNNRFTNLYITSVVNGNIANYSVVSYDGTVVTSVTTAATSVTIRYSTNLTYDERSGNVVLKQDGTNKTITINVSQSAPTLTLDYNGILLDGTSGSNGSIPIDGIPSFSNVPSWANVVYSDGSINITASSANSASTARLGTITVNGGSQSTNLTIIQLPSDYHSRSYVTIGGTNWAIKNVGASSVKDYGNYYQWGAAADTYKNVDQYYGWDELPSSRDTATQVMGSGWRTPTQSELGVLTATTYYWVSYNGVNGAVFDSSGNVLFIPAAGYYSYNSFSSEGSSSYVWCSTCYNRLPYSLVSTRVNAKFYTQNRRYGYSVRGVHT